jgi:hypothetical protein
VILIFSLQMPFPADPDSKAMADWHRRHLPDNSSLAGRIDAVYE